jgi:predicted ATPase
VVFVEESEAHLPLRAQRLIARLLVRAANTDETFVIITTHSDYLLSTLSSLVEDHVMLSGKEKEKLEELGYDMLDIPERFLLTCLNWEKRSLS